MRGGYFYLMRGDELIALLWSDANEEVPMGSTTDPGEMEILDFGVSGPGPDHVALPEGAPPGDYRLCTANSLPEVCAAVTVIDSISNTG